MKKFIVIPIVAATYFLLPPYTASYVAPISEPPPVVVHDLKTIIADDAAKYGISPTLIASVIYCESNDNPKAVGDQGKSFGLVQIHMPDHPEVTLAEAFDQEYAVNFLAKNIADHKGNMWTCYRIVKSEKK